MNAMRTIKAVHQCTVELASKLQCIVKSTVITVRDSQPDMND